MFSKLMSSMPCTLSLLIIIADTFRCEIIPNSVALHHREDVLLYKIQADAALSFYIGVLEVQQKVDDWIASFSRMNSPVCMDELIVLPQLLIMCSLSKYL